MHYFITKIPNKQKLQQIAINHSSAIGFNPNLGGFFKDFLCSGGDDRWYNYPLSKICGDCARNFKFGS